MKIRKAKKEDISKIVAIHKKCVLETNAKLYSSSAIKEWVNQISAENVKEQFKNSSWYVLSVKNRIMGFTQFSLDDGELYQININSNFQDKGYGKILYNFVENQFVKNKVKEISLNSTLNAFEFYKGLGFKSLGEIKIKLDKSSIKMIKMRKAIKS